MYPLELPQCFTKLVGYTSDFQNKTAPLASLNKSLNLRGPALYSRHTTSLIGVTKRCIVVRHVLFETARRRKEIIISYIFS